jgi:periplasmic protein TonB
MSDWTEQRRGSGGVLHALLHGVLVAGGGSSLTLAFFLVLPLMQSITEPPDADTLLRSMTTAEIPPPPPPPEEEPEEEPEPEEAPPELTEAAPPLELSQLELALDPGAAGGWGGDVAVKLDTALAADESATDALFSMADLDQVPRAIHQPSPVLSSQLRQNAPGTVHVIFVVDERGRVDRPIVQSSSDPLFEAPALAAVKQWRFEPGKRAGKSVRFRMRVPITFAKGR